MSANKHIIGLGITIVLTVGQSAVAQQPAGDSAYQWGRWAVLSPAAGGEPFRAPDAPGAAFNVLPGEFFSPEVESTQRIGIVPVNPGIPVVTAPPTVAPPPPPPPGLN